MEVLPHVFYDFRFPALADLLWCAAARRWSRSPLGCWVFRRFERRLAEEL